MNVTYKNDDVMLVSRAIRIFHVLIIERAPQKGGRGRKNTYGESGHVFMCTAKILAAPIRIQSRTHHVTSHLKYSIHRPMPNDRIICNLFTMATISEWDIDEAILSATKNLGYNNRSKAGSRLMRSRHRKHGRQTLE